MAHIFAKPALILESIKPVFCCSLTNRRDYKDYGALLFSKDGSDIFAVVLGLEDDGYAGAEVLLVDSGQLLGDIVTDFCMKQANNVLSLRLDPSH